MTLGSIVIIAYFPLLCGQLAAWPYSQAAFFGEYFPAPLFSFELTILTAKKNEKPGMSGWLMQGGGRASRRQPLCGSFECFWIFTYILHTSFSPGVSGKGVTKYD